MITLFVALYSLLCLCTAVNTSDIKELQVKTVKRGEDVTMECDVSGVKDQNNLVWYTQSFRKVPRFLAKPYSSTLGYTFDTGFTDIRFSITVDDHKFDLNINGTKEEDGGDYFCGELEGNMIRFTSGTRLEFQDEVAENLSAVRKLKKPDSVTLQCPNSTSAEGQSCTHQMHVFFWLSISRLGVLFTVVISLAIFHMVLKSIS